MALAFYSFLVGPWLAGLFFGYCWRSGSREHDRYINASFLSSVALLGGSFLYNVIRSVGASEELIFIIFIGIAFISVVAIFGALRTQPHCPSIYSVIAMTFAATPLVLAAYQSGSSPLSSWDSLNHWAKYAKYFLDETVSLEELFFIHRHPLMQSMLLATPSVESCCDPLNVTSVWRGVGPFLLGISCHVAAFGVGLRVSGSIVFSALFAYSVCTIPLLENHSGLYGYADYTLSVLLFTAFSFLMMQLQKKSTGGVIGAASLILAAGLFKSYAVLYFVKTVLVLLLLKERTRRVLYFLVCLILFAIGIAIYASNSWVFLIPGSSSLAFNADSGLLKIFGRKIYVFDVQAEDVAASLYWTFFKNKSFSIILLAAAAVSVAGGALTSRGNRDAVCSKFLRIFLCIGFLEYLLFLTTSYGATTAGVGVDTLGSRILLPLVIIVPLVLLFEARDNNAGLFGNLPRGEYRKKVRNLRC